MLRWALVFLIVALMAAIAAFGGISAEYAAISRIIFFAFISLFTITLGLSAIGLQSQGSEQDDELSSD